MLTLPRTVRLYLAAGATDMRKSFDTLAALVDPVTGEVPLSGHLFAFSIRARSHREHGAPANTSAPRDHGELRIAEGSALYWVS